MGSLKSAFDEYFEVIRADTPELLREVFHLRYRVYCEEARVPGFDSTGYPDGLETDSYDRRSVHALLRHRASGSYAGTVRLVLADPRDCQRPFPVESFASQYFDPRLVTPAQLPRARVGEISRLIVAPGFRVRAGEQYSPDGLADDFRFPQVGDRRRFPHTILGLFVAIVRLSVARDLTYWYAAIGLRLAKLLERFGVTFQAIGPEVDHCGLRRPYLTPVKQVMDGIFWKRPEVWDLLTSGGALFPPPVHGTPSGPSQERSFKGLALSRGAGIASACANSLP